MIQAYAYGFPRLGNQREFKKLTESYWKGAITEAALDDGLLELNKQRTAAYDRYQVQHPVGELTLYDKMLDTAIALGVYQVANKNDYYELCRGKNALEMTKWFNTNYHYLVPDLSNGLPYPVTPPSLTEKVDADHPAYFIGPFTWLKLAKGIPQDQFAATLLQVAKKYQQLCRAFPAVHLDEPAFVLDVSAEEIKLIQQTYAILAESGAKLNVFTYYDTVDWLPELLALPVAGIGLDFVHGSYPNLNQFPADKVLYAGVVDGRNVFRTNLAETAKLVQHMAKQVSQVVITNAAPLSHLPVSIHNAKQLQPQLEQLAFAEERLFELQALANLAIDQQWHTAQLNRKNTSVQKRIAALTSADFNKSVPYAERIKQQQERLHLPLLPTTTIGSYPQTTEVRENRALFRSGKITAVEYQQRIEAQIKELIAWQENLGLDVLVHGEFERTDMVEYFAERLDGMLAPSEGWIISYGTRCYRAPVIYGDVSRPRPMTIQEIAYAQSLTDKPVKGMLTGPVTIIAWSFCRQDIPTSEVAYQIALCLQDEIRDYEAAGIKIVQVDEPAFRELAPLKKAAWPTYFAWATKAFRLTTNTNPSTQIHSHMCYSEFNEIIEYINQMDFDVISIECSRSKGEIIEAFKASQFDKQIGLGVWDIHSPAVPSVADMKTIIDGSLRYIPANRFWINPDCGLKTRAWPETKAALTNLVAVQHAYAHLSAD